MHATPPQPTDPLDAPEQSLRPILPLVGDYITLAQALKAAGLADNGGQAKHLIREGGASVNGEVDTRPGRKLRTSDRFQLNSGEEWLVE